MASVGIDLGTTNSVIARLEGGRPVPIVIDGSPIVPSVVLFDGERIVIGKEALNLELLHPERTVRSVKRRMGSDHSFAVGDRMITPEQVSSEILRALKEGAERAMGEPVHDVVITVPAYFDDAQRRATLRAGELAGLHVLRLLNEPTSASLCYEQVGAARAQASENVLVYDLGGGTFDVSILEVFEGVREVRATAGNTRLGGDDFDDALVALFVEELRTRDGVDARDDVRALARLRRAAEQVKIRLSSETRTQAREEFLMTVGERAIHLDLVVTRRQFELRIKKMVESTIALVRKALDDAGMSASDLSRILLVGGSTRIPLVRSRLEEEFRVPVHEEVDVDLAVGLGAAVQSAILGGEAVDRILVDVTAHSLGIRVLGGHDDEDLERPDTFAPVLRRNTVLPSCRVEEFYTMCDGQTALDVDVFQGEQTRVSGNTPVGSFVCALEPRPAGSPVSVEFSYDLNGIITVSVSQPGCATKRTVAMSVADAAAPGPSPVEKKAIALLARLSGDDHAQLEALLGRLRAGLGDSAATAAIEDELLDFFSDVEDLESSNEDLP